MICRHAKSSEFYRPNSGVNILLSPGLQKISHILIHCRQFPKLSQLHTQAMCHPSTIYWQDSLHIFALTCLSSEPNIDLRNVSCGSRTRHWNQWALVLFVKTPCIYSNSLGIRLHIFMCAQISRSIYIDYKVIGGLHVNTTCVLWDP